MTETLERPTSTATTYSVRFDNGQVTQMVPLESLTKYAPQDIINEFVLKQQIKNDAQTTVTKEDRDGSDERY